MPTAHRIIYRAHHSQTKTTCQVRRNCTVYAGTHKWKEDRHIFMNASTRILKSRRKSKQEEMIIKMNSKHALIQVSKCKHMLVDKKHADKQSHSQINSLEGKHGYTGIQIQSQTHKANKQVHTRPTTHSNKQEDM